MPTVDSKPVRIDKTPSLCPDNASLRAGDILIFNYNHHRPLRKSQCRTMWFQGLINESGGHKDTVHAAMVVEVDGELKIAHLRAEGFALDDINTIKTTTHVYRPAKHAEGLITELNSIVSKIHGDPALSKQLHWSVIASIRAFLRRSANSLGTKNSDPIAKPVAHPENLPKSQISGDSICSKFIAQTFITACYRLSRNDPSTDYRRELMNIGSFTTPKTLQAYLYRNINFNYLVMPSERNKIFSKLLEVIDKEIVRLLDHSENMDKFKKGQDLYAAVRKFMKTYEAHHEDTDPDDEFHDFPDEAPDDLYTQSIALLKKVVPILKRNTGNHIRTALSYANVMQYAKSQGLYSAYINSDLVFPSSRDNMEDFVKDQYQQTQPMAEMYAAYRELGYTDEEAKFETSLHPGFGDWFKLNPVKNSIAVATVVPFIFFSLPYGAYRAISTGIRNRHVTDKAQSIGDGPQ